jgi:hypothetical protein
LSTKPTELIALLRASEKFRNWKPEPPAIPPLKRVDNRVIEQSCLMKDERHFTPQELAELWSVSVQTIREIFQREEGVLKIGRDGTRNRRRYKTLRIPESVAERVHTRLSA